MYCGDEREASSDHVLSEWCGCRATLSDCVCARCNSEFGRACEGSLYEVLAPVAELSGVPQGAEARRKRVYKADIGGKAVPLVVDQVNQRAELGHPVVHREPLGEGRSLVRVVGSGDQNRMVLEDLRRRGFKIEHSAVGEAQPEAIGYFNLDVSDVFGEACLPAFLKYAANYSRYVMGATMTSAAFARQADLARRGEWQGAMPIVPFGAAELLECFELSPPHHTCAIGPCTQPCSWFVFLGLFGIFTCLVFLVDKGGPVTAEAQHLFPVDKGAPVTIEQATVRIPVLDSEVFLPLGEKARRLQLGLIAKRYHALSSKLARERIGAEVMTEPAGDGK